MSSSGGDIAGLTLKAQLIVLVSALLALLFIGTFLISVYNTRDYVQSQLATHAQDAATSLGLSASSHMRDDDRAIVTSMVNAMIHRGDYLSITLADMKGNVSIRRDTGSEVDGVPPWFMELLPLRPPQGEATMMEGWKQVGRVAIVSHPGLAYRQLWDSTRQMLGLFAVGALVVLVIGVVGLRFLLKPLQQLEWQADAICRREFPIVEDVPFTREFRPVVTAMNRLSGKVHSMLESSDRMVTRLRQQAFEDPVTGLANRRQFMAMLAHRLGDRSEPGTAALLLLELKDFKSFNQTFGFPAGDELLRRTAEVMLGYFERRSGINLAHLSGAGFAALVEDCSEAELPRLAEGVAESVSSLYEATPVPTPDVAHLGAVMLHGQSATDLLSEADQALRQAQQSGANAWIVRRADSDGSTIRTATEWRELISRAVDRREFHLLRQPVYATDDRTLLHEEVFIRLPDPDQPGKSLPAAQFMPMAANLGIAPDIDRAVINQILGELQTASADARYAVNMAPDSLAHRELLDWLQGELRKRPCAGCLILEFPEYGALSHLEELRVWIDTLGPHGVQFSIDHFGKGFASFTSLKSLKVHYLKVDGSFVLNLDVQADNQFFIHAITEIAHGLDMRVIAEGVETRAVFEALSGLGVDGGRGYWLGRPT